MRVAAARSFWAVDPRVSAAICGELAATHLFVRGLGAHANGLSRGRQGVLAEVSKRVVAALEEFAGEREAGAVAADPLCGLQVVVAVGAAGMACLLRGLVQRPAQRGRSLT